MSAARRLRVGVLCASIIVLGSASPSVAADPIFLPGGTACQFDLLIEVGGDARGTYLEFKDRNGNIVRTLTAGTGNTLTFTNGVTGATHTLISNGAVDHVTLNPDGTQTHVDTGHNVLILFPTDVPAGPSTTLYIGQVVFDLAVDGTFTLQSASGKSTDICAALR